MTKKLAKQTSKLKYLLTCRKCGLTPTHLSNTTKNTRDLFMSTKISQELRKIEQNFHNKILNLEVKETNIIIKESRKEISTTKKLLKSILNDEEYPNFINRQNNRYKAFISSDKQTHSSKIHNLKVKQLEKYNLKYNPSWFVNKTNIIFTEESKWLLSLGSKFAIPVNNDNYAAINLIADLEQWVQTLTDDREKDIIRSKIANRIMTHKRTIKNNQKEKFILNIYEDTKRFLRRHKDEIVITKSDKGNKTVIIYKNDYNKGMQKLLEDKVTYKLIKTDPTLKLQRANNKFIIDLYKQEYITGYEKMRLTSDAATAPRLYGLPKIHKPDVPLRPISSSVEVPCYNLSKYIGNILKNIILEKYNIKNSLELKSKLGEVVLDEDDILISLDVVSLFTNIPTHLAISNIMAQWDTLKEHTKIPRTQFLKLLKFCLNDNNYFVYGDSFYLQTYGMPMGNPLSPTIADIVLDMLLEETTKELRQNNIQIKILTKYVDDLFAIIKRKDEEIILKTFNSYHNKLKFTIEKEENGFIPYLDMKIFREDNKIITDWYSKSVASGRLINYHSTHPNKQKINTATNMITKIIQLSDDKFKNQNIQTIKDMLIKNSYPKNLINSLIDKVMNDKSEKINRSGNPKYYSLPYIPKLTEGKQLKEIITNEEVCIAHKPNKTINALFTQTKTKIENKEQSCVVYEVKCLGKTNEECGKVYIGTTKRSLGTRINEHETDIRKNKYTTALAQHCIETGHTADLDDVRILDKERKYNKRFTLESLRIQQKAECAINEKGDKDKINANYTLAII